MLACTLERAPHGCQCATGSETTGARGDGAFGEGLKPRASARGCARPPREIDTRTASLHPWRVTPGEAARIQERLRARLLFPDRRLEARLVAGADLSFTARGDRAVAGVVVVAWPGLETVEERVRVVPTPFPYVPGLLSFREIPALLPLFHALLSSPDLVLCDGQGIAHPRGFGLASHLGLLLGVPTIGCAKSILVGRHGPLGPGRGARARLVVDRETRGAALRTRAGVRPVIVSPGHLISLAEAIRWTLRLAPRFRIPEPTRRAHLLVGRARREEEDERRAPPSRPRSRPTPKDPTGTTDKRC